jgi:hypothetical protein
MRILRFSAFFVVALLQYAFAQSTPPPPTQQPTAVQAPDKNQPQPPPPPSNQPIANSKDQQPVLETPKHFKFEMVPAKPADKKLPTGTLDRGFRAFMVPGAPELQGSTEAANLLEPRFQRRMDQLSNQAEILLAGHPQGNLDRGIYARDGISGTGRFCGAIVSYNFSSAAPGEMPILKSVTTCTPSNAFVPRRARGRKARPGPPQLIETVLSAQ